MQFSEQESSAISAIADALHDSGDRDAIRKRVGVGVARLLDADFMASYVWDPVAKTYSSGVSLNHDPYYLRRYADYYQFHDPITPVMSTHRRATIVDEVLPRNQLERSEFWTDFLSVQGQHYGINYFAYRGSTQLCDLRIWRKKSQGMFTEQDRGLLEIVGQSLLTSMPSADHQVPEAIAERLTDREVEIVEELLLGLSDDQIALRLNITHATVRTHLLHIFDKLQVNSRLGVVSIVRGAVDHHHH